MTLSKARDPLLWTALTIAVGLWLAWLGLFAWRAVWRAPEYANEAEVLYEAARVAKGLPLYTNPLAGAHDDGSLPIRHYVLYGPIAPYVLALFSDATRLVVARSLSVLAWFVGVPLLVLTGRGSLRALGLVVALSYCGLFLLARDAVFFTLTPIAVCLGFGALARIAQQARLDAYSIALLALAAAVKPVTVGLSVGLVLATLTERAPLAKKARALGVLTLFAGLTLGALQWGTRGLWLTHLSASTNNGFLPLRWLEYLRDYFPVLGLPHLAVGLALLRTGRHRWTSFPLIASTLWAMFAMAKRGANAAYFMEPSAILALAIAHCDAPARAKLASLALRLAAPLVALLATLQSLPYLRDNLAQSPATKWALLAEIRRQCELHATGTHPSQIRAGLPELEYPLSGIVTLAPWQHFVLVRAGKFPLSLLEHDLAEPALTCLVLHRGLDGLPPPELQPDGDFTYFDGLFDGPLREAVRARFQEFKQVGDWHLFGKLGEVGKTPHAPEVLEVGKTPHTPPTSVLPSVR